MNNILVIWGTGGHGKVVLDVARSTGRFERILFFDDDPRRVDSTFCYCSIIGGTESLNSLNGNAFIVAVGDNRARSKCFSSALEHGLVPAVLVHKTSVVSSSASIGRGTVVMPDVVVNADAVIGENCIINTGAIVEHDCQIANHVHISPRVVLGGCVCVKSFAHIGIGAVVLPGATVGEESIVGAGAVVLREAPARSTSVGVPARTLPLAAGSQT
jgi:acetyltransferase EpsM